MRFKLIANDELVGYSELEGADPTMGARSGKFVPHGNYSKYQSLFRKHLRIRTGMRVDVEPPDAYKQLRQDLDSLRLDSLRLRIETDDGEAVRTVLISLEDFSEDLGADGYELLIVVDGRSTYEKFFE